MCFVQRDVIGRGWQEVRSLTDKRLQMKFKGLPVEQDDRTRIPCRLRVWFQVHTLDKARGGFPQRPGVKMDFDVAAVVPGSLVDYRLRLGRVDHVWLLGHRCLFWSSHVALTQDRGRLLSRSWTRRSTFRSSVTQIIAPEGCL